MIGKSLIILPAQSDKRFLPTGTILRNNYSLMAFLITSSMIYHHHHHHYQLPYISIYYMAQEYTCLILFSLKYMDNTVTKGSQVTVSWYVSNEFNYFYLLQAWWEKKYWNPGKSLKNIAFNNEECIFSLQHLTPKLLFCIVYFFLRCHGTTKWM